MANGHTRPSDSLRVHITVTDDDGNTYVGTTDLLKTETKSSISKKVVQSQKGTKKAPQVILDLYMKEYFKENRPLDEVIKKLNQMRYNFDKDTVRKALERADYLTNKGNRTYIEKYPPG